MEATKANAAYSAGAEDLGLLRKKLEKEQRALRIHAFLKNKASVVGLVLVLGGCS